ncbi:MAG: response regulator [Anaerolineae bacterium]|nr:response regulator [Anaerolineae bacterium]
MNLQHTVMLLANGLSLGITMGLIFVMLIQPRRTMLNVWFSLYLAAVGAASYASLARLLPDINSLSETDDFYVMMLSRAVAPVTLYWFVIVLCRPTYRFVRGLTLWTVVVLIGAAIALWSHEAVAYTETGQVKAQYDFLPMGYAILAHVFAYSLIAWLVLQRSDDPRAAPLRIPALLLPAGYLINLFAPLRGYPISGVLATVAAILIGYAVLRWQLFIPLSEANTQLSALNNDLRLAFNDLAAEKERTEQLNDELLEANRYKSKFLANMSHELRTPLNSIVGYSELMLNNIYGPLTDKQADRVEKIFRNGHDLLALINDILDLSRIEGGRLELNLGPTSLEAMTDGLLATIDPLLAGKDIDMQVHFQSPLHLIHADELRIRQVLVNLLSNAIKFTTHGHIRLSAQSVIVEDGQSADFALPVTGWLEDRRWLVISVEDTGIGIPPEDQARIFEEFRQADGSATRQYEGAGLGLAITKRLVELHTGRIWVRSQSGAGSTFFVALPALEITSADLGHSAGPATGRPTVLIVEDRSEAADILTATLEAGGYHVVRASDSASGLARAHDVRPAAILVDILMPCLSGWEVIWRFRQNPATAVIPLVIVSVIDDEPSGLVLGRSTCIRCPVQRDELLAALAHIQREQVSDPAVIINDDPDERDTLCNFLNSEGITTLAGCQDAQTSLAWLRDTTNKPGLVLLDLNTTAISSFEVVQLLRNEPGRRHVPLLVLCAESTVDIDDTAVFAHTARVIRQQKTSENSLLHSLVIALDDAAHAANHTAFS